MKSRVRLSLLLGSIILATVNFMSGCATSGMGRAPDMVATLQSVKDDFDLVEQRSVATEDALVELSISPDLDLKQAYETFSKNVDRLQEAAKAMLLHADAIHFVGRSYLVESEKTAAACVYPRLRVPEDRHPAEVGEYFDAMADESWEVKRAYRAYQLDIRQIQSFLSNNLTPIGLDTISPFIAKAKVDSDSLIDSLDKALATMDQAKTAAVQTPPKGS